MDVVTLEQAKADAKRKYSAGAIDALTFGVSHSASAATNRAALQAAVDAAVSFGADLRLPALPAGETIDINDQINVEPSTPMNILGVGEFFSAVHQTVKPKPIFYVTAPDVSFDNLDLSGDGLDMTGMGTPIQYAAYCGIWFGPGSDRGRATRIKGQGFHRLIRVDPDPTTVNAGAVNVSKMFIDDIEGTDCWCVLTVAQATNSTFLNIRGNSKKATASDATDVGQPDHLIYSIDRTGSGRYNVNNEYGNCHAYGSEIGKAYALKGNVGGSAHDLYADACHGLLDNLSNTDFPIFNINSHGDVYPQTGTESAFASVSYASAEPSTRSHIYGANVSFAHMDHGKAYLLDGDKNEIHDATATGNLLTENVATAGPNLFLLKGTKNRYVNCIATSVGSNMFAAFVASSTGQYGSFINPRTVGNFKFGVHVTGHDDCTIDYDPAALETNGQLGGATDLSTAAKPLAIGSGTVNRPKIRPRDRAIPNGPEFILFDRGTNASFAGHAGRATSGQGSAIQTGSWTTDLTDGRGRLKNTSTSTTVPGVLAYTTAREASDTATPNFTHELEVIYNATNANGLVGLAFRSIDGLNTLGLGFQGNLAATPQLELFKLDASATPTVLGAPVVMTPTTGRKYVLKVVCFGNLIQCYLDGALVITHTLAGGDIAKYAAIATAGYYCMLSGNTLFGEMTTKRMS